MVDWEQFAGEAPRIAEVFLRRHTATKNLCLLATLRTVKGARAALKRHDNSPHVIFK